MAGLYLNEKKNSALAQRLGTVFCVLRPIMMKNPGRTGHHCPVFGGRGYSYPWFFSAIVTVLSKFARGWENMARSKYAPIVANGGVRADRRLLLVAVLTPLLKAILKRKLKQN